MTTQAAKIIADRYINRDGSSPKEKKRREKKFTLQDETAVLKALREIARGQNGGRPLPGRAARDVARRALNDIMRPWVG